MWRTRPFIRDFEEKGHAFFCGKFGVYPVKRLSSVIIKKEEDLALADNIMRAMRKSNEFKVRYDRLIKSGRGA
jgi:hypothetical protein